MAYHKFFEKNECSDLSPDIINSIHVDTMVETAALFEEYYLDYPDDDIEDYSEEEDEKIAVEYAEVLAEAAEGLSEEHCTDECKSMVHKLEDLVAEYPDNEAILRCHSQSLTYLGHITRKK